MYVIIHEMGNESYYHIADTLEVANKVGADICMDLLNDLEEKNDWLQEQMEGCNNQKRYNEVIELWNYHAQREDTLDKVWVLSGLYHKE